MATTSRPPPAGNARRAGTILFPLTERARQMKESIMRSSVTTGITAVFMVLLLGGCATTRMQANCNEPNYALAVAGTVIGGLLGGQIGAGTGRHVAIAAGAGLGAVAGSRMNCP
jgi:hypothetical protein